MVLASPTPYQENAGSTKSKDSDELPPKSGLHDWAACTALDADWPSMVRETTPDAAGSAQWGRHSHRIPSGSGPPVKLRVNDVDPWSPATLMNGGGATGSSDAVPVTVTEQT